MYTTPSPPLLAMLFKPEKGGITPLLELAPRVQDALNEFRSRRHALGILVEPNDVARAAFEADATLGSVLVLVQKMHLDRETALMTSTKQDFWYDRQAFAETGKPTARGILGRASSQGVDTESAE